MEMTLLILPPHFIFIFINRSIFSHFVNSVLLCRTIINHFTHLPFTCHRSKKSPFFQLRSDNKMNTYSLRNNRYYVYSTSLWYTLFVVIPVVHLLSAWLLLRYHTFCAPMLKVFSYLFWRLNCYEIQYIY